MDNKSGFSELPGLSACSLKVRDTSLALPVAIARWFQSARSVDLSRKRICIIWPRLHLLLGEHRKWLPVLFGNNYNGCIGAQLLLELQVTLTALAWDTRILRILLDGPQFLGPNLQRFHCRVLAPTDLCLRDLAPHKTTDLKHLSNSDCPNL